MPRPFVVCVAQGLLLRCVNFADALGEGVVYELVAYEYVCYHAAKITGVRIG